MVPSAAWQCWMPVAAWAGCVSGSDEASKVIAKAASGRVFMSGERDERRQAHAPPAIVNTTCEKAHETEPWSNHARFYRNREITFSVGLERFNV